MPNYSQGPILCQTGGVSGSGGVWNNPNNLAVDDGISYAQCVLPAGSNPLSENLYGSNFGFTIPGAATILGFQFSIKKWITNEIFEGNPLPTIPTFDNGVYALKALAVPGGATDHSVVTAYPTSVQQFTYGDDSDLWGSTWGPSDINGSGFGMQIASKVVGTGHASIVLMAALYSTVFFQVTGPSGSNGGVTAFERIALYPANGNIWAFDPLSNFNDPIDGSNYFWRVEELAVGRKPTISRLFVTYRDLGLVNVTFTITAVQDNQTVVSSSAAATLGNASPTGYLMTKEVDMPQISGMNFQLSASRLAGAGPLSIAKIKVCGRMEVDSYS
jgi:hypothetical protein